MKEGDRETIAEMIERIEAAELARIKANQDKKGKTEITATSISVSESIASTSSATDEKKLREVRRMIESYKR